MDEERAVTHPVVAELSLATGGGGPAGPCSMRLARPAHEVPDEPSREDVQAALDRIYMQIKGLAPWDNWEGDWAVVNAGIRADIAVTVSTPDGYVIRVLPAEPVTGPDRLEAVAITFPKTDSRRHQLLRLAHEWRLSRASGG